MYTVDLYRRVRRAHFVEGMSIREAARVFGQHRNTVNKKLEYSVPPGYRQEQPPRRPKLYPYLDPYKGVIDRILEDDQSLPKKQRHTARRICDCGQVHDSQGLRPGASSPDPRNVRAADTSSRTRPTRSFGKLRTGFGEAWVVIGGAEQKAHYFAMDLPHSDACYVKAYPAETTEETAAASGPRYSPGCSPTICSMTGLAVRAREMIKGRWKVWWGMLAGTSWCPSPRSRASRT